MPLDTRNSRTSAATSASLPPSPSRSSRPRPQKKVSFEQEQGEAAAAAAATAGRKSGKGSKGGKSKRGSSRVLSKEEEQQFQEWLADKKKKEAEEKAYKEAEEHAATVSREQELERQRARSTSAPLISLPSSSSASSPAPNTGAPTLEESRDPYWSIEDEIDFPHDPDARRKARQDRETAEKRANASFKYTIHAALKSADRLNFTKWENKIGDEWQRGRFNEHTLQKEIDQAMNEKNIPDLSEITGRARSTHSKGTWQQFTLSDLSKEQWESRVESILHQEHLKYYGKPLEVNVICTGKAQPQLRRPISTVEDPNSSPSHRHTRTVQLEERHRNYQDQNEAIEDQSEKLITRWKCQSARCGYEGMCYIAPDGTHLRVTALYRERWASAIVNGEATELAPPLPVYVALTDAANPPEEKKKKKKFTIDDFMELQGKRAEIELAQAMSGPFHSHAHANYQQQQYLPVYNQQPPIIMTSPHPQQQPFYPPHQLPPPTQEQQRSSPVAEDEEEEEGFLESY